MNDQRFLPKSLTLLRRVMVMLEAGCYSANIARVQGKKKQHISYFVKRLEKMGFIEKKEILKPDPDNVMTSKKTRGVIALYAITQIGQRFLDGIERTFTSRALRLHNVLFKYPVLKEPALPVVWRKVELMNWAQLIGVELGLRVRKNTDSIEIVAAVVDGRDPYELLFKAKEQSDFLASYLEQKFDMVLGRGSLSRKPHFGIYDPVTGAYSKFFELDTEDAKIDESEGYGEIDWLNPEAAKAYLIMPSIIRKLERDISEIKEGMRLFSEGMMQHMKLIQELRDLVKTLEKVLENIRRVR